MITIKEGNLLNAAETIIGHQVNCCGAAGGLAALIFSAYPDAENDYYQVTDRLLTMDQGKGLLGIAQFTGQQKDGHIIANLYGQLYPGQDYRPAALEEALRNLAAFAKATGKSVALPYKLSCGICGGDWTEVQQIIERTMEGVDCAIYRRKGDR